ncbi:hypothetical protein PsYK624_062450 [Phanerochaete sordida]|uniref:Uncharacterized protein n=1 Tax=Phanerochaete sordida TaxID=48140 RepID=A0A9P3G8Q3_9APHY|nr:hypothetical protein PsYK624_062450 [Phanerochaete sordida]
MSILDAVFRGLAYVICCLRPDRPSQDVHPPPFYDEPTQTQQPPRRPSTLQPSPAAPLIPQPPCMPEGRPTAPIVPSTIQSTRATPTARVADALA